MIKKLFKHQYSSIGLVVLFVLAAGAMYYAWMPASLAEPTAPADLIGSEQSEAPLALPQDMERFLKVYFNQQFDSFEQKAAFINFEQRRFNDLAKETGDQDARFDLFVEKLNAVATKLAAGAEEFPEEDAALTELLLDLSGANNEI